MADSSRDRMLGEIASGGAGAAGDASSKVVLVRGCDPVVAERAGKMLPPMTGNAQYVGVTDTFLELFQERSFDAVMFAPSACRPDAAGLAIPGSNAATQGWALEQYREKVRETQGEAVPILETTEEKNIVPLLRGALGLE